MMDHAPYLESLICPAKRNRIRSRMVRVLNKHRDKFDAIVFTGVSGTWGAVVADRLNVPFVIVRKAHDDCHSSCRVESPGMVGDEHLRVVFVDDLVSSGSTLRKVDRACVKAQIDLVGHFTTYENSPRFYDEDGRPCCLEGPC